MTISDLKETLDPENKEKMLAIADTLTELLAPLGFALFIFNMNSDDTRMNYISNGKRADLIKILDAFVKRHQQ